MKYFYYNVVFLLFFLCFVSCSNSNLQESSTTESHQDEYSSTSSVSDESSEGEIKNGTFVETYGNEKITREYRDGMNDYTVTTETFFEDGSLYQKTITDYKNEKIIRKSNETFNKDGSRESTVENYNDSGTLVDITNEAFYGKYIQKKRFLFSDTVTVINEVMYYTVSNEMIAEGHITTEEINDVLCSVERLSVFDKGQFLHKQVTAVSVEETEYNYYALKDKDDNALFVKENTGDAETIVVYGKDGFVVTTTNESTIYTESDGDFIAELQGANVVKIGSNFNVNEIASVLEAKIKIIQNNMNLLIYLE